MNSPRSIPATVPPQGDIGAATPILHGERLLSTNRLSLAGAATPQQQTASWVEDRPST